MEEQKKEEEELFDMPRNNILLQRFPEPRYIKLPNGRVFFVKYQRVGRERLPERVKIRRTYVRKTGPRRQRIRRIGSRNQVGRALDLSMAIDLARRAAGSRLGKIMINNAIEYIPTAHKKIKNKIKTKKVKAALDTGVDYYVVNKSIELIGERFVKRYVKRYFKF